MEHYVIIQQLHCQLQDLKSTIYTVSLFLLQTDAEKTKVEKYKDELKRQVRT